MPIENQTSPHSISHEDPFVPPDNILSRLFRPDYHTWNTSDDPDYDCAYPLGETLRTCRSDIHTTPSKIDKLTDTDETPAATVQSLSDQIRMMRDEITSLKADVAA